MKASSRVLPAPSFLACSLAAGLLSWSMRADAAAQDIQRFPQPGVVIEQTPQRGVENPALPPIPSSAGRRAITPTVRPPSPSRTPRTGTPEQRAGASAVTKKGHRSTPTPVPEPRGEDEHTNPLLQLLEGLAQDEAGAGSQALAPLIERTAPEVRAKADSALIRRVGWALYRRGDDHGAIEWFDLALRRDPADLEAREGLFFAARRAGRWQQAYQTAEVLPDQAVWRTRRAEVAVQAALEAREQSRWQDALAWLERARDAGRNDTDLRLLQAWTELQAGHARAAVDAFSALYAQDPSEEAAEGLYQSLRATGDRSALHAWQAVSGPLARRLRTATAQDWLDRGLAADAAILVPDLTPDLQHAATPSLALTGRRRDKSGAPGTSALHVEQAPLLDLRWHWGTHLFSAQVSESRWDAGAQPRGVGSTVAGTRGSSQRQATGIQGLVQWRPIGSRGPFASLGWTPRNAPVPSTWVGSVGWRVEAATGAWSAALRRATSEESTLAAIGLKDPASGRAWGRVLRQGLDMTGYRQINSDWNGSASVVIERLDGQHVASNTHVGLRLAGGRRLEVPGMRYMVVGPYGQMDRWTRNLSGFTWGHGGYFSPQRFTNIGVQIAFESLPGRSWIVAGDASSGIQSSQQNASPCFPLPPPVSAPPCTGPGASRQRGFGSQLALRATTLLHPHWALEGRMQWQTGVAYRDFQWSIGLRYFTAPRQALFSSDLPVP